MEVLLLNNDHLFRHTTRAFSPPAAARRAVTLIAVRTQVGEEVGLPLLLVPEHRHGLVVAFTVLGRAKVRPGIREEGTVTPTEYVIDRAEV